MEKVTLTVPWGHIDPIFKKTRRGQIRGVRWTSLFPRLKSIMKGARFADVAAIQERVAAVLRSIPKETFADSFQELYERCQQCVV
jgi:hypothetical protein